MKEQRQKVFVPVLTLDGRALEESIEE